MVIWQALSARRICFPLQFAFEIRLRISLKKALKYNLVWTIPGKLCHLAFGGHQAVKPSTWYKCSIRTDIRRPFRACQIVLRVFAYIFMP